MIPILFNESATVFETQGLGALTDALSCKVTEERNGQYTLDMTYKATGAHAQDLKNSRIIYAVPSRGTPAQAFRIYDVGKTISGDIAVNAEHVSYQLSYIPVMPFAEDSASDAMARIKSNSAEPNPFVFDTDIVSFAKCTQTVPSSARAMLGGTEGSMLDVYGGELEFDNYNVHLQHERGTDKSDSIVLRYGKDITDLKQDENIENTYTGVCPYYHQDGVTVTLPEKVVQSDKADNFPYHRTLPLDLTSSFDDGAPTVAELRTEAARYITKNRIGIPNVNLNVSFVDLASTMEYADMAQLENINLCDTISVVFEELGIDTKAKVIKTVWDVLGDKYESIEIGDAKSSLAQTIAKLDQTVDEQDAKNREAITSATAWLTNGKGYVKAVKNTDGSWKELLFLDQPTTQAATKVLRINENGIGFASGAAGTFDSWEYYQAWTLDGNLSIGGVNNAFGTLHILDNSGQTIGTFDKDGIEMSQYSPRTGELAGRTSISSGSNGVHVEDENGEDQFYSDLSASGLYTASKDDDSVNSIVAPGAVSVSDSNGTVDITGDDIKVNGTSIVHSQTSGYTGHFEVVIFCDPADDYVESARLTFENGILTDYHEFDNDDD